MRQTDNGYSRQDLVDSALEAGHPATPRLVTDWVRRGLLDEATPVGRGRAQGVQRIWPESQRRLFLILLKRRAQLPGKSLAPLYNIPVGVWLFWGEAHVRLAQVRRAMESWATAIKQRGWSSAGETARLSVDQIERSGATREAKDWLFEVVAGTLHFGDFDAAEFRDALSLVFDAADEGRVEGPEGARLSVDALTDLHAARYRALASLSRIPDDVYEVARSRYQQSIQEYTVRQPVFGADREIGELFQPRDLQSYLESTCLDLLTLLGLGAKPDE